MAPVVPACQIPGRGRKHSRDPRLDTANPLSRCDKHRDPHTLWMCERKVQSILRPGLAYDPESGACQLLLPPNRSSSVPPWIRVESLGLVGNVDRSAKMRHRHGEGTHEYISSSGFFFVMPPACRLGASRYISQARSSLEKCLIILLTFVQIWGSLRFSCCRHRWATVKPSLFTPHGHLETQPSPTVVSANRA